MKAIYQRNTMRSTGLLTEICGSKSTTKRVLKSLEDRGLVKRVGYGRFKLTMDGKLKTEEFIDEV